MLSSAKALTSAPCRRGCEIRAVRPMPSIVTMYLSVTSKQGRKRNKQRQNRTNLINQELKLDDSSAAVMLTVALHACSAKAESHLSQEIFKQTWQRNAGKNNLVYLR